MSRLNSGIQPTPEVGEALPIYQELRYGVTRGASKIHQAKVGTRAPRLVVTTG